MSRKMTKPQAMMSSNLAGRIRNTDLPISHAMMPLFEAVINSIHAIEDRQLPMEKGCITIEIERTPVHHDFVTTKKQPGPEPLDPIANIIITDNGIGFNALNFQSFNELDSDYKAERNCRGIGRLMWLKAFKEVEIESYFLSDDSTLCTRKIKFDVEAGVKEVQEPLVWKNETSGTKLKLCIFEKKYRDAQTTPKTAQAIARSVINHCCWYFLRPGGLPVIRLIDDGSIYNLDDIFAEIMGKDKESVDESVTLKGIPFTLTHTKLRDCSTDISHSVFYCAGKRLVEQEALKGKIPGLFDVVTDDKSYFTYACYVTSSFLDSNVSAERTGFKINESQDLFGGALSFDEIRELVIKHSTAFLGDSLEQNRKKSDERLNLFVNTRAPRYKSILKHLKPKERYIDPKISDKELELLLHKKLSDFEQDLIDEGHSIMIPKAAEAEINYRNRISNYLTKVTDIKQSDLANYVAHRRTIIDILRKCTERRPDGKYALEDAVHQLIMPMRKESDECLFDDLNLWIIDERLAFHNYLASDKTIKSMPITSSTETSEPDILALQCYDNPIFVSECQSPPYSSITIVEFKRPMRNDASNDDKDPILQALNYLDEVRKGNMKTSTGHPIPKSETLPGFCYIICDVLSSVETRRKIHQLKTTSDGLGYFGYNPEYNAYIEVITYDRLVNSATERNKAFFDRLGLPTN